MSVLNRLFKYQKAIAKYFIESQDQAHLVQKL